MPDSVLETAIYTQHDGVVDWRYCMTGNADNDFEVPGTHIGLAFNSVGLQHHRQSPVRGPDGVGSL